MDFELRDATPADLQSCVKLLRSPLVYDPDRPGELIGMWNEIIRQRSGMGFVATEPARGSRVVYFSFVVFVSDERAASYRECRLPLISRQMVRDWTAGRRPFLDAAQIARGNSGPGVNAFAVHYGSADGDQLFTQRIRAVDIELARRNLTGWNLRSMTVEVFPAKQRRPLDGEWGEQLGYQIGRYSPEQLKATGVTPEDGPYVWTATRDDALRKVGYAVVVLFGHYTPPRCGFTPAEQQILMLALDGKTDEAIAEISKISLAMVKKRFRAIYEKFAGAAMPIAIAQTDGTRGPESRRRVLNYLRDHPEELRPYAPDKARPRRRRARAS